MRRGGGRAPAGTVWKERSWKGREGPPVEGKGRAARGRAARGEKGRAAPLLGQGAPRPCVTAATSAGDEVCLAPGRLKPQLFRPSEFSVRIHGVRFIRGIALEAQRSA